MVWIGWLQYISPIKYAFEAVATNEFQGAGFIPDPIDTLGFTIGLWESIGILIGYIIFYRVLAFVFLKSLKSKI